MNLTRLQYAALLVADREGLSYKQGVQYYKAVKPKVRRSAAASNKDHTDFAEVIPKELITVLAQNPIRPSNGYGSYGNRGSYANHGQGRGRDSNYHNYGRGSRGCGNHANTRHHDKVDRAS